jgi:hypothetical protein
VIVYLKDGRERLLPTSLIEPNNAEALVSAIREAIPAVFVRHLG